MVQLTDDFTLSKDTTLEDIAKLFKHYNGGIGTLCIGDCLIVVALGKEAKAKVKSVVDPMMDDDQ